MLRKLCVRNYAIIDELELDFGEHMNIITGETGAGKSILVGAIGLLLGERADTKVLYRRDDKCVVEGEFDLTAYNLTGFFETNQLDYETHTIIRREINPNGKSRAFVNDTPVPLNILKELGEQVVHLHQQHEMLDLARAGFQLQVVDALARNKHLLQSYAQQYLEYKQLERKANELEQLCRTADAESDFLRFQLQEFEDARPEADELERLEQEQRTLANTEAIQSSMLSIRDLLDGNENSLLAQLSAAQAQLKNIKNISPLLHEVSERLSSVQTELKDLCREVERISENTHADPHRLDEVNARLNVLYRLLKKHRVQTIAELLNIRDEIAGRLQSTESHTAELENVRRELIRMQYELRQKATELHASREKVLREFQNHVCVLLAKVGMPGAVFKVEISQETELTPTGVTQVRFLFSANRGFAPQDIKDVASGGELSRLLLCIKSLIAGAMELPTLIFDEIDAGISGEVALKVGEIMRNLSRRHQMICITHLPQIARTADKHIYLYKEQAGERTCTRVRELNHEERIRELAKMLSGDQPTEAAMANARELILI
ncbi:MAG: DNA repair protein RecN [Chitinophagales bacterium]|nr:DNA repair protein RecN [Chitinophagales bacterium]MDW8419954.1 DNA repair protein RecN [Chitinophagales bacterium]